MTTTLTAEQIQENWDKFKSVIKTYINGERKDKLLKMYEEMEEHIVLAPASISKSYHNCFPGGYVDHVLRVVHASLRIFATWKDFGSTVNFTEEELVFSALNHDLGKLGTPSIPGTLPNDNSWEIEKLGRDYKVNPVLPFSTVPDRSLFILQSEGIPISHNEYLAIKLHDGLYDEANKPYLISYQTEAKLRTNLPLILHQADMLASRVEWEKEWMGKVGGAEKKPAATKPALKAPSSKPPQEALKRIGAANPGILNALKGL